MTTDGYPPASPRPACKQCGGKWNGGGELLCNECAEALEDFFRNDDPRESDREIVL